MRFPSIKTITDRLKITIKRFPFELLFALIGTISGIVLIEISDVKRDAESWCLRLIMMADLGLLLSLSATLFIESKGKLPVKPIIIKIVAALFAVLLILILDPYYEMADRIRFFLLSLSFHLLVSFAAFTAKGHVQGFWQFNKALFLRFLEGALYSAVLFAGISAALGAMNFLFGFKFEWDTFVILWTIIVGLFHTTFVLSGIPIDISALDADESYPKGLKVFTQYVLIPLATIYVAILLSYELKILVQWNLPKGLVSNLILCYAVFGILSILLVYPIREREENKWIKTYARSFYFLLVPLIVLLLLAVGTRVFKYGITELRYFLIALACWLLYITIYFLTSKKQNIKVIPISLCILTLLTIYGPQSTFSVSKYSQQQVLINIFKRNNAFKDGKLIPVDSNKIAKIDGHRAVNTLNYLVQNHDMKSLQPYLSIDLQKVADSLSKQKNKWNGNLEPDRYQLRFAKLNWVQKYLHLGRFSGYGYGDGEIDIDSTADTRDVYFTSIASEVVITKGFDYYIDKQSYSDGSNTKHMTDGITFSYKNDHSDYSLGINNDTLQFNVKDKITELLSDTAKLETYRDDKVITPKRYNIPSALLEISAETARYRVIFKAGSISFKLNAKGRAEHIEVMGGSYLIKVK